MTETEASETRSRACHFRCHGRCQRLASLIILLLRYQGDMCHTGTRSLPEFCLHLSAPRPPVRFQKVDLCLHSCRAGRRFESAEQPRSWSSVVIGELQLYLRLSGLWTGVSSCDDSSPCGGLRGHFVTSRMLAASWTG